MDNLRTETTSSILGSTFSLSVLQTAGKPDYHPMKTCHKEPRGKTAQRNGDREPEFYLRTKGFPLCCTR